MADTFDVIMAAYPSVGLARQDFDGLVRLVKPPAMPPAPSSSAGRSRNRNAPPGRPPGHGGRPPSTRGGRPRPTCSRPAVSGAPPPPTPAPTPRRPRRCARPRSACAPCTLTPWPAMTGSASRSQPAGGDAGGRAPVRPGAARAPRPASRRTASDRGRTPGTASWPDAAEAANASAPQPGPRPDLYQDAEQRGQRIAERLQARALAERGSRLSPDELATAMEASTSLPAEVIARLARADSEENIATRAERARAADLDRAAAAASPRQSTNGLTAARRDTVTPDTAGAHASADRTAAQLAAESFPCTTADGIRAAVNGRLQQPAPSPARTAAAQNAPRPGLAP